MKKTKIALIASLFCLGTVDYVEDNIARVEFRTDSAETYYADIPVNLFPCDVQEGSSFYVEILDGVTEIRCGEPE